MKKYPHSVFSVSPANALSEGDSGWRHSFTTPFLKLYEGSKVLQSFQSPKTISNLIPFKISDGTSQCVRKYHSAGQPAPFKELEISPYFIHSYTGFPLITIRLTVYNE